MQFRATVNILYGERIYHHSTFGNTEENSDGHEVAKVTDNTCTCGDETECENKQRKIIFWADFLEKNVGRDFDSCVWEKEGSQCDIELGSARSGRGVLDIQPNPSPLLGREHEHCQYSLDQ
jgi:hypothetical protein